MKTIKNLLVTAFLTIIISLASFSQVDGFTFQSDRVAYAVDDYEQFYISKDIFSLSINDGYFFHIVINAEGKVVNSQAYRLLNSDINIDTEDGFIIIEFIILSGKSGMRYIYELLVDSDNNGVLISDQGVVYGGNPTVLSAYKQ